jgi:hypothetical protein
MLNYSNTINHDLFDFKLVIIINKVYNLINPFLLNLYIANTCNFARLLYIKVARLIFEKGA